MLAAEAPPITSRSKLRSPSSITSSVSPNPFAECHAPKFAPEKTELRYHTSSQLGQLLRELREDKAELLWPPDVPPGDRPLFYRLPIPRVGAFDDG